MIQPRITIQVTQTRDGLSEYVQITSEDQIALNIVLIANEIEIRDDRKTTAEVTHE